jgi:membrane protein implicated in regulation of membrane protease activity
VCALECGALLLLVTVASCPGQFSFFSILAEILVDNLVQEQQQQQQQQQQQSKRSMLGARGPV